jgi:hypothetical protein
VYHSADRVTCSQLPGLAPVSRWLGLFWSPWSCRLPGSSLPDAGLGLPAPVSRSENRPQVRLENGDPTIRSPYPSVNKRPSRGNNRVFGRRTLGVFLQAKRAEMDARSSEFSCRRPARSESRLLSSASASSSTKTEETPYVHRLRHVLFRRTHG